MTALLLSVVVVSLLYLFTSSDANSNEYLFGGEYLTSPELRQIEAAFGNAGLEDWDTSGGRIRVPRRRRYEYLAAITKAGAMPRNLHTILEDTLSSGAVWESRETKKRRWRAGVQKYVGGIIGEMDWVENAYVIYDESEGSAFRRDKKQTASVSIMPMPGESLTSSRKRTIQNLVRGADAGLGNDDIVINNLGTSSGSLEDELLATADMIDAPYYRRLILYETDMRSRIENMLDYIPGVRVEVRAELDPRSMTRTHQRTPEGKEVAVRLQTEDDETTNTTTGPGGRPGLAAQQPGSHQEASGKTVESSEKSVKETIDNVVGVSEQWSETEGYTPQAVSASVQIPRQHLRLLWERQWQSDNVDADPTTMPSPTTTDLDRIAEAETTRIQDSLDAILPDPPAGEDKFPRLKVTFYESESPVTIPEPSMAESSMVWMRENWATVGMFLLAGCSLLMLRSALKTNTSRDAEDVANVLQLEMPSEVGEESDEANKGPKLKLNKGPSLKDGLADVIREDPDAAASILRTWISNAA